MILDVNKLAINRLLQCSTLEEYDYKDPDYIYKADRIDSSGSWYSITKNGYWSKVNKNNGISANNNIVTQINFALSGLNYISDLFILVDYSKDYDIFSIYRDTYSSIQPNSQGIFGTEYILCSIPLEESKKIYDKFLELKQRLK